MWQTKIAFIHFIQFYQCECNHLEKERQLHSKSFILLCIEQTDEVKQILAMLAQFKMRAMNHI